jgi:hypothetical protein
MGKIDRGRIGKNVAQKKTRRMEMEGLRGWFYKFE